MTDFVKAQEVANKWGVSERQVQFLCKQGRINGATKFGNTWAIPKDAKKPMDLRKVK